MNLCIKCLKTFKNYEIDKNQKSYITATCKLCNGDIVEVDELILPTIIELNRKNWTTEFSCSGHLDEGYLYTYIKFKFRPSTTPEGFYFSDLNCITINDGNRNLTGLEGYKELLNINTKLYEWALSLSVRRTSYEYR